MNIDMNTVLKFTLWAMVWGITYYFVRRGLNPEVTDLAKFRGDAIFGSLANFVASFIKLFLEQYLF